MREKGHRNFVEEREIERERERDQRKTMEQNDLIYRKPETHKQTDRQTHTNCEKKREKAFDRRSLWV